MISIAMTTWTIQMLEPFAVMCVCVDVGVSWWACARELICQVVELVVCWMLWLIVLTVCDMSPV